jgi:hypothetical protein
LPLFLQKESGIWGKSPFEQIDKEKEKKSFSTAVEERHSNRPTRPYQIKERPLMRAWMRYAGLILIYSVLLSLPEIPAIAQQTAIFAIDPGTVEGNINDNFYSQRYSIELDAGQTTTITMQTTSGDLDPYLYLSDSSEQLLAQNDDDDSGSRDAQIVFTPQITGRYIIEATRFRQELGDTTGTYRLEVALSDTEERLTTPDPLTESPGFGVEYTFLDYDAYGTGTLSDEAPRRYFALGGRQGEFLRMVLTVTAGDVTPSLRVLDSDFRVISRVAQQTPREMVVYAALPQTDWYLVEVTQQTGSGEFTLFTSLVSETVLTPDTPVEGTFTPETPSLSYVFNATINERVFFTLIVTDDTAAVVPELRIIDLSQDVLASRESQGVQTSVAATIPRSGAYIVQVQNNGDPASSNFQLAMRRDPQNIGKLRVQAAEYNDRYSGTLNDRNPIDYYRFSGKAGELVTLLMEPATAAPDSDDAPATLDPYVILADASLNELAFNDNAGASRSARIAQFSLPENGDYLILATRPGLSRGESSGAYRLELTVGQIALQSGTLTATLHWEGDADLNLFMRAPSGETISWAYPQATAPGGGRLQIDSNTGCDTPTAQPVEHIYWPGVGVPDGDYEVWVWYQNRCGGAETVEFELQIAFNGQSLLAVDTATDERLDLIPGSRFETSFRINEGRAQIVDAGHIRTPSPQQSASQGGDTLILFNNSLTGTLSNDVYARFYQFEGRAGQSVTIRAQAITGNLDPIVVLRSASGVNLALNDDGGAGRNAQLTHTLPADGRYVIAVTRYGLREGTTTGDYRLMLERAAE